MGKLKAGKAVAKAAYKGAKGTKTKSVYPSQAGPIKTSEQRWGKKRKVGVGVSSQKTGGMHKVAVPGSFRSIADVPDTRRLLTGSYTRPRKTLALKKGKRTAYTKTTTTSIDPSAHIWPGNRAIRTRTLRSPDMRYTERTWRPVNARNTLLLMGTGSEGAHIIRKLKGASQPYYKRRSKSGKMERVKNSNYKGSRVGQI